MELVAEIAQVGKGRCPGVHGCGILLTDIDGHAAQELSVCGQQRCMPENRAAGADGENGRADCQKAKDESPDKCVSAEPWHEPLPYRVTVNGLITSRLPDLTETRYRPAANGRDLLNENTMRLTPSGFAMSVARSNPRES